MAYEYYITNKHYHTLDYYLKTKYKKKVFKIPLNASFSCPNRDGLKSVGGCAFCSAKGSGDFAGNPEEALQEQFENVKQKMELKWKEGKYIVYFQAFSNTYGPLFYLKKCFEPFINKENVIGLSIATRCDCLSDEVISYLEYLNGLFPEFWVELGLQTSNKKTAQEMNLQYDFKQFKTAVKKLNQVGIQVVAHIIDGLPFEGEKEMLQTICDLNTLPIHGLKIHCLNIISDSPLGKIYQEKPFKVLSREEFIDIVIKQLVLLRDDIIIHRIGADSDEKNLLAPTWVRKKISLMDEIDKRLDHDDLFQGDLFTIEKE